MDTFFNVSIPIPSGIHLITARTPAGNTSAGIVAPENSNIGKYKRLVATFIDFVVRHRPATKSPIENIETIVSNHTPIKAKTFPLIRYPKRTAAIVNNIVEMIAIILLERISQESNLTGEHGLQYILRRIP